jgi:D-sedoheptulose 7-phosphate isomerase
MKFINDYLEDLKRTLAGLDLAGIEKGMAWLKEVRDKNRTVYVCGNGGSASIASHLVVDILKGASYGHKARFKIISLADSLATVTAYANDVDYDSVFIEQLRNFAQKGDVLLAISGSGNSRNVLKAVEYAKSVGCRTIGLTTAGGGALKDMVDLCLGVPNNHMGRLEDCFTVIVHLLAYAFMDGAVE